MPTPGTPSPPDLNEITSDSIRWVVIRAMKFGVHPVVIADWSNARVVHMGGALPDELRGPVLFERSELEFYRNGGDPHNTADEGFMHEGWCVSFPIMG